MVYHDKYYYLVKLAYDGRNLYGVQEVQGLKTLSSVIRASFKENFPSTELSIMRSSRLDKGVSARELYLHLIVKTNPNESHENVLKTETEKWLQRFNMPEYSLKFLTVIETAKFHILSKIKNKTYRYFFSAELTSQPYVVHIKEKIDPEILNWAVREFIGEHHFKSFSIRGREGESDIRQITAARVLYGDFNLNPIQDIELKNVWCFEVTGNGFMRGQVRMMMGALLKLCSGQLTKDEFIQALRGEGQTDRKVGFKVPATGLILWKTELDQTQLFLADET